MFDTICNWVMERVWALHGMNCKEAIRLASRCLDAPLGLRARVQLRIHFLLCCYCHYYYQQQLGIRKWLRRHAGASLDVDKPACDGNADSSQSGEDCSRPDPAHHGTPLSEQARTRILRALSRAEGWNNRSDG